MREALSSSTIGRAPKIACRVNKRAARVFPTSGRGNRSRPAPRQRDRIYGSLRTPGATRVPEPLVFRVWCSRHADGKFFRKNTIDLQWQKRANYNARLCASLRKAAGAGTMENNEKNNAQNNGNSRRSE